MRDRIDRFRRVLRARETVRDLVQKELADLRTREEALLGGLRRLRDEKQEYIRRFAETASGDVTIEALRIGSEDISRTEDRIKRGIVDVLRLRKHIEGAEKILIERHKDVRKVEIHLEQMELRWEAEQRRREQRDLDDMAGMLHDRKKGPNSKS